MRHATIVLLIFLNLGLVSQSQAGVVLALHADFNADVVGQAPDASLPGDPVGDQIAFWGSNSNIVVSGSGEMADQPLKITRTGNSGITRFKIVPEFRSCESYVLRWTSMIETSQASTTFTIRDTNSSTKAVLGFQGNRLWTGLGYSPIYPDMGFASAYDKAFTFEMSMDITAGTYSLSLNGSPIPEMQDYPLYGGDFDRIEVAFGGSGGNYIFVDDITVSAGCASVATEKTTWGSLKTQYR